MNPKAPAWLVGERSEVQAEIRAAFANVRRDGGVSWQQALVIDGYGSVDGERAASRLDGGRSWEQVEEDLSWDPDTSLGGFSFLDAKGFRYYLPAALIRCLRTDQGRDVQYALDVSPSEARERHGRLSALDKGQKRAVARALRHLSSCDVDGWYRAYKSFWRAIDSDHVKEQISRAFSHEGPPPLTLGSTSEEGYFRKRSWEEIPESIAEMPPHAYLLLPPDALAYYLPGLLTASIDKESRDLSDGLQDILDRDWSDLALEVASRLTTDQRAAVWEYIRLMETWDPPGYLKRRWYDPQVDGWMEFKPPMSDSARGLWIPAGRQPVSL